MAVTWLAMAGLALAALGAVTSSGGALSLFVIIAGICGTIVSVEELGSSARK
ncbi:MAG: hypothetical protein Q7T73_03480 [Beijerinckiaceae bacterium]|nr:hypothetical protein [Beijerinckiaceae bacterium]